MTAKELIERLKLCDPHSVVTYGFISTVEIKSFMETHAKKKHRFPEGEYYDSRSMNDNDPLIIILNCE